MTDRDREALLTEVCTFASEQPAERQDEVARYLFAEIAEAVPGVTVAGLQARTRYVGSGSSKHTGGTPPAGESASASTTNVYTLLTSAELKAGDYRPRWHVKNLLVA